MRSGAVIQVRLGDMTTEAVDCIVNAANSSLDHASGLAGALSRKGGPRIQAESDEWVAKHGRLEEGQAAVTTAGLLPARHLLHAVGPTWRGGQQGEPALLQMAVRSCLTQAHALKCVSISLPAISSGIFGYPKPTCARDMFEIVLQYLDEEPHTSLREIRFTNFDEQTVACFEEECKRRAKP